MEIKITFFITLLLYALIASRGLFYLLARSTFNKSGKPVTYIAAEQMQGTNSSSSLSLLYYPALAASVALTSFCVINPSGFLFISSIISLVLLVIDAVLAVKGSKWLTVHGIGRTLNITGFISLLAGLLFGFN